MRKIIIAALLLLSLALPALAEDALPQGVVNLCEARYPAYIIAAHDGWGDETLGQFALVLTDGADNILCIAEKAEGDAAYAFTVENTNAVREGADIPSLMIDTAGDVLFYSYWDDGLYQTTYHCAKDYGGEWGKVQLQHLDTTHSDYDVDTWVGVDGTRLFYNVNSYDKLENPTGDVSAEYMDIPVSAEFADQIKLATFNIDMLSANPSFIEPYPGLCGGLLEEGDELLQLAPQRNCLLMLVRKANGTKRLRICSGWDEYKNGYAVKETWSIPEDASMDVYHMWDGVLFLGNDRCSFNFTLGADGEWHFTSVQSSDSFGIVYDGVESWEESSVYRNDHVIYGRSPWNGDIIYLDLLTLPRSYSEAVAQLNTYAYALVDNPNPADRLHLRTKPQKSAASLGKFYNRTPVYVIDEQGEWAHVRIGSKAGGLEGYMMKQFLTRDEVACAFPQKHILPNAYDEAVFSLKAQPKKDAEEICTVTADWYIIGVVEDDWYVIMTRDGVVGYALQGAFYDGNG